ncbi:MAG: hypothetical protein H6813_01025 [Phycisphaeraceae bacterium]|nr:hypothetical protein [Phycisphaeraceae bacterium]
MLPDEFSGKPVVLLIGYQQRTQFDIDRWMLGLLQTDLQARIVEVPKIPGLIPSLGSGWIDDGMRAGIPEEDWGAVVTLNGCAAKPVAEFTGTEYGKRARVIVLASEGQVVWFSDRCYSASQALEVADLVTTLQGDRIRCVLDPFCGDSIDDASVRDINENNLLISGCFIS